MIIQLEVARTALNRAKAIDGGNSAGDMQGAILDLCKALEETIKALESLEEYVKSMRS